VRLSAAISTSASITLLSLTASAARSAESGDFAWVRTAASSAAASTPLSLIPQSDDRTGVEEFMAPDVDDPQPSSDTPDASDSDLFVKKYGARETWWWNLYGMAAVDVAKDGEQYGATWAASYFLEDNFSVDFEFAGWFFNQPDDEPEDTVGGNFNILFRWHFLAEENWTMYFDGGAGLLAAADEVPYRGTNINFTPQAGAGMTFDLGPDTDGRLMLGLRWFHMSNARIEGNDENPGRNALEAYVGVSFPF